MHVTWIGLGSQAIASSRYPHIPVGSFCECMWQVMIRIHVSHVWFDLTLDMESFLNSSGWNLSTGMQTHAPDAFCMRMADAMTCMSTAWKRCQLK